MCLLLHFPHRPSPQPPVRRIRAEGEFDVVAVDVVDVDVVDVEVVVVVDVVVVDVVDVVDVVVDLLRYHQFRSLHTDKR